MRCGAVVFADDARGDECRPANGQAEENARKDERKDIKRAKRRTNCQRFSQWVCRQRQVSLCMVGPLLKKGASELN